MEFVAVDTIVKRPTYKKGEVRNALCDFISMGVRHAKVVDASKTAKKCYASLHSSISRFKLPIKVEQIGGEVFVTNLAYER